MMGSIWFLPTFVTRGYGLPTIDLGFKSTYHLDRGWVELASIKWFTVVASGGSAELQHQQNNYLKTFILTFLVWFIIVLFILV
jgi:hypothetical protein